MLKSNKTDILNENICKDMVELVDDLINKQYKNLDEDALKKLQNICGDSDNYINRVYSLLLEYLKKEHSEIRYNAFYIFSVFFKISHSFRKLAVEDLKTVLHLTADINHNASLPPPKAAAEELKRLVLHSIKEWTATYGSSYKRLNICFEFLLRKKRVDFNKLEMENHVIKRRKEEAERKKNIMNEEKLRILRNEISDLQPEIENIKQSLESCLKLLIPTPEQFYINEQLDDKEKYTFEKPISISDTCKHNLDQCSMVEIDENCAEFREAGMIKGHFSIDINLPENKKQIRIMESEENSIIIENAAGYYKLLNNKYLNVIKNWIKSFTLLSDNSAELKKIIDMKANIENIIQKYNDLIFEKIKILSNVESSDSDSEMEDATPYIPTADEEIIANLIYISEEKALTLGCNPVSNANYADQSDDPSSKKINERKIKLMEIAPKLPFDVDLYHWEDENLSSPLLIPSTAEGRQFWSASAMEDTDGIPDPEGVAGLRTRIIEFTGKFERVKWRCRFPLPNGKLCPRQDRFKCPFHGKIVARNETGKCMNREDEKSDRELAMKSNFNDAQNPELLAEIQRATGVDLRMPDRKKRKKSVISGLTDIKKENDTVHKRLEKKLFKKSTIKKIARSMDKLDHKRFRDKFGDHFQYIHNTTST